MNIYSLPAVIAFTLNFSIAMLVLLDRPGDTLNRWFSGFVFLFAVWNLAEIIILNSVHYEKALLGAQILYRALFLTPPVFLIIAGIFPRTDRHRPFKPWHQVAILALPVLIMISSFPDFNIFPVPLSNFRNIYYYRIRITSGISILLLIVLSLVYIAWGTWLLIRKLDRARTTRERTRIRFLLGGVLTIFLGYIFINIFHEKGEKMFSFYFFSTLLTLFVSLFFFAAIMQYKIFRLSRLITGSMTYTILSSLVLTVYFLVIRGLSNSLGKLFHINSFLFDALLILILIILIRPLEARIEKLIDRLLYKNIYRYRKNFLVFSRELLKYFSTDRLFQEVRKFLKENFFVDTVYIFYKDEGEPVYRLWKKTTDRSPGFSLQDYLIEYLSRQKTSVEFYDMDHDRLTREQLEFLTKLHISIILPLFYEKELVSFILIPEKNNKKTFTHEEIEILTIFSNEIANALVRNRTIEKIREQERERSRMERLAAIGELTAGVAHEIRNPLNTISTSAETLLYKELEEEDKNELLQFILEESQRLNHILSDFLKLSKIRNIHPEETDIGDLLRDLSYEAERRNEGKAEVRLVHELRDPVVMLDKDLVYQVLLNLVINALDAIRVRQQKEPDYRGSLSVRIRENDHDLLFIIEDDGQSIPPEVRERIFNPFYTTKKDGTGLGLSISSNLVKNMGGTLTLEIEGDLKRFRIELPRTLPQDNRENDQHK